MNLSYGGEVPVPSLLTLTREKGSRKGCPYKTTKNIINPLTLLV